MDGFSGMMDYSVSMMTEQLSPLVTDLPTRDPAFALRDRLLDAALDEAAFYGWTATCVRRAREAAGLSEGEALLAAPRGAIDLIDAWFDRADQAMKRAVEGSGGLRVRAKATLAVRTRLEALGAHKEALRRAVLTLALPPNAATAVKLGWRGVDRTWKAMGDTSTDFNFYSKRAILGGVHASSLAFMLQDESEGHADTWAFLDRRIENVMGIEKIKGQVSGVLSKLPDPLNLLSRIRYGAPPRP
jgi:ubiquinone biosynthesis protein COQ9